MERYEAVDLVFDDIVGDPRLVVSRKDPRNIVRQAMAARAKVAEQPA